MKYASFFSGIGGFEAALDSAGFQRVFSCEIEPFCNEVFKARWGHECEAKDITKLKPEEIPDADLWVGGFPCQDLSVAGKRGGLQANRSGLVWRFLELAAVRRPHAIWLENVPGLLSSERGRDFALLLREMEDIGYLGTWRVLDAQYLGVPQRRRRVFIVGHLGADCGPEILLEPQGGGGNPPKGRQKGKIASGEVAGCLNSTGNDGGFRTEPGEHIVAHGVSASKGHHGHSSPRRDGTDDLVVGHAVPKSSGGGLGGRDGQDDYVVGALASHKKKHGSEATSGQAAEAGHVVAAPLTHGSHPNSNAPSRRREDDENIVVAFQSTGGSRDAQAGEKSPPTKVGSGCDIPSPPAVAFSVTASYGKQIDSSDRNGGPPNLIQSTTIRRLTPTECERLQGFPDGHTCLCQVRPDCPDRRIPPWIDPATIKLGGCGHSACGCKCSGLARYRTLGNAVAVPVIRWIAERMKQCLK